MILETLVVGPLEVNCYLLAAAPGREAVVIDPGGDGERILARLHEQDLALKAILNTHGHFDHIGANRLLKEATGAEIVIHEKDAPMLPAANELARLFGGVCDPSPPASRFVSANETLEIAGLSFKVHHTPGHSEGGVCFQVGTALFVGDTLFAGSIGRTDLAGGSFRDLIISIQERILPLGDHITLYPGHGPSSTIAREKRTNPYLTELKNPYF